MTVAMLSGSAKLIPIFAAHGEKTGEKFLFFGMAEGQPAIIPATMGDAATVRALLDAGLPVDTTDLDEVSLLDWAVMCHRPTTARLLIARGADVNHVDRFGMTPLQHAALFDFGDSQMIDLLRGAGARIDARTKDGLTALDLARKYGHLNLLRSLGGM
jgi:ankyrin repeat protein